MELVKTADNDRLLRLEAEGGAITVKIEEAEGRVLSVFVPEEGRRRGMGLSLLKAAEYCLYARGIRRLRAYYSGKNQDINGLFERAGYSVEAAAPVLSISVRELLSSSAVRRMLSRDIPGADFSLLSEMFIMQIEELQDRLEKIGISVSRQDFDRLDPDLSGGVYDEVGELKAVVLCSLREKNILVELLYGEAKKDPKYILKVLGGLYEAIQAGGGDEFCNSIFFVAANQSINDLQKLLEPDAMERTDTILEASKELGPSVEEPEPAAALSGESEEKWIRELKRHPVQYSIYFKLPLIKGASDRQRIRQREEVVQSMIDKRENATEGLLMEGSARITSENLDTYRSYLSPDALQNVQRPFFRGLAVKGREDAPGALMVWEYKNFEEEKDTESEIAFFSGEDEAAAKQLLREYTHELQEAAAGRSFFETPGLSGGEKDRFLEAGFSVKEGESRDMILTLRDISQVPVLRKKPTGSVSALKTVDERDYRRAVANFLFHGRKGLLEDLALLPQDWFDTEISSCIIMDNKAEGMLLIHRLASGRLFIDFLFSIGAEYKKDLLQLLRFSLRAALEKYGAEAEVVIRRHSKEVVMLTERLFPDRKGDMAFFGERKER